MSLFVSPIIRALDANGNPLPGATLTFYQAGTLVLADVYTTSALTTPHSNPVVADAGGLFAPIYLDPNVTYRAVLKTAAGVTIQDVDPYDLNGLDGGFIAPFTTLAATAPVIGTSVNVVRTSGFATAGTGSADYVYSAAVNAAYVTANPLTSFLAADGRGFRLVTDQIITPYMFGATATVGADNAAPLQAFFDFVEDYDVRADQTGTFYLLNTGVILNRETGTSQVNTGTSTVDGVMTLLVSGNITGAVIENTSKVGTTYGGFIVKPDTFADVFASLVYADKKFDYGFNSEGYGFQQTVGFIQVFFARLIGVNVGGNLPETNTYASSFPQVYCYGCGSGVEWDVTELTLAIMEDRHLKSTHTSFTAGGTDAPAVASYNQTTVINGISVFPPTNVEGVIFIRNAGGEMFPVKRDPTTGEPMLDRTAGTATVYGRFAAGSAASAAFYWIFGGGFRGHGGDSATLDGKLVVTGSAIGIQNTALYPGHFIGIVQFNAVGYVVGTDPTGASVGGSFKGYWERNTVDVWTLYSPLSSYSHVIVSEQALRINKMKQNIVPRDAAGVEYPNIMRPRGLVMEYRGARLTNANPVENDDGTNAIISFDRPLADEVALIGANVTIAVNPYIDSDSGEILDYDHDRMFGLRARKIVCRGPSTAAPAPTTITVTVHAQRKLNGGALGASTTVTPEAGKATTVLITRDMADPVNYLVTTA